MKKITITSKKIVNGKIEYKATITPKDDNKKEYDVSNSFNAYYLSNEVELKMIDNIIMLHIQNKTHFNDVMNNYQFKDFSKLKRLSKDTEKTFLGNKDFKEFFNNSLKTAKEIKNLKVDLLKPIVKTSKTGKIQPMPCYYYLCGIKKANVNYLQSDFNLKTSDYEKEQVKEHHVKTWFKAVTSPKVEAVNPSTKVEAKESTKAKKTTSQAKEKVSK